MNLARPLAFLAIAGFATLLGLGSAALALRDGYGLDAVRIGAWTVHPNLGGVDADPYARASVSRNGTIPLAIGEGLAFVANRDDDGRRLRPACRYRLAGTVPTAQAWTLAAYTPDGSLLETHRGRPILTSAQAMRFQGEPIAIAVSVDAEPGNWLALDPRASAFVLVLRVYDTPASAFSSTIDRATLPTLERIACG